MTKSDRANFGSKLGVILASAGSAVGLGNIWRFPFETGNHGGIALRQATAIVYQHSNSFEVTGRNDASRLAHGIRPPE